MDLLLTFVFSIVLFCIFFIFKIIKERKSIKLPRGFKKIALNINTNSNSNQKILTKDRYKKSKVPNNLDYIIIGSGISGLTIAELLSEIGQKVLVLEQHDTAGGSTHTFMDHGYEFDTGFHYIGNIHKRKEIFDIITDGKLEWDKMGREKDNEDVYDEIVIEGDTYKFRAGRQNFINDLVKRFPEEKDAIHKYMDLVSKVAKLDKFFKFKVIKYKWLSRLLTKLFCNDFFKYVNKTTYDVISNLTNNKRLIAVLCGQFGDVSKYKSS